MQAEISGSKKGVSIVVSLGIVMVFMLLAASITPIVISQMKQSAGNVASTRAYYAAESGLQKGLYVLTHMKEMKDDGTLGDYVNDPASDTLGGSVSHTTCSGSGENPPCEESTADWRIFNSSDVPYTQSGEFSYPIPGTGTAGTVCDPFNPVVSAKSDLETECEELEPGDGKQWAELKCSLVTKGGPGWGSGGKPKADEVAAVLNEYSDPRDLPCNWNKIKYGETAQIPLYGSEGALSFEAFKLRVRTPCKAVCDEDNVNCEIPELCSDVVIQGVSEGRYVLDSGFEIGGTYTQKSKSAINDVLILWSVEEGECGSLKEYCFLSNMVSVMNANEEFLVQFPSLITANRIKGQISSSPLKYLILDKTSTGLKNADKNFPSTILTAVPPISAFLPTSLSDSSYFKLHYAKQGIDSESQSDPEKPIPYLEYQLLYKANDSLISADPLVISEGYAGGFKQTLQARYNPKTGAINYVVQQ